MHLSVFFTCFSLSNILILCLLTSPSVVIDRREKQSNVTLPQAHDTRNEADIYPAVIRISGK